MYSNTHSSFPTVQADPEMTAACKAGKPVPVAYLDYMSPHAAAHCHVERSYCGQGAGEYVSEGYSLPCSAVYLPTAAAAAVLAVHRVE